jgi:hypothetical protein
MLDRDAKSLSRTPSQPSFRQTLASLWVRFRNPRQPPWISAALMLFGVLLPESLSLHLLGVNSPAEPKDDIGIVASFSALPPDVLGAVFGASPDAFNQVPRNRERVVIARKPGFKD